MLEMNGDIGKRRKMKVGDKVWVPVKVVEMSCSDTIMVEPDNCGSDFWVVDSDVQTVTEEEYRNALDVFTEMTFPERREIWGANFLKEAIEMTAEEFVGRLRKYRNEPKVGQIWETPTGEKMVVLKADESGVHYFAPSGNPALSARGYFENKFHNTGEVLTSLATFLKDLEGLNEEG